MSPATRNRTALSVSGGRWVTPTFMARYVEPQTRYTVSSAEISRTLNALPDYRRQICHAARSFCQSGTMRDVAVVVSAPVPAFELGIVSELFGLPRIDPALPRYRYAVCAGGPGPLRTSTGFAIAATHGLRRLATADLIIVTGAAPPLPPADPRLAAALRRAAGRGATVAAVCTGAF